MDARKNKKRGKGEKGRKKDGKCFAGFVKFVFVCLFRIRPEVWGRSMGAVTALMHSHRDPTIAGHAAARRSPLKHHRDPVASARVVNASSSSVFRNFTGLVLGCIEAKFCKKICV